MAPEEELSGLVEHLAEAEQTLSGNSGDTHGRTSSSVASEERDSTVEAAAVMDDLQRSTASGPGRKRTARGAGRTCGRRARRPPTARCGRRRGLAPAVLTRATWRFSRAPSPSRGLLHRLRHSEEATEDLDGELSVSEAALVELRWRSDSGSSGGATQEVLRNELEEANLANVKMADELRELRLQMVDKENMRQVEVGDLTMLLDTTGSGQSSSHLPIKPPGGGRKVAPKTSGCSMAAIAEDDSDAGSACSCSGGSGFNVSGDSDGSVDVVGDFRDFEDDQMLEKVTQENSRAMAVIRGLQKAAVRQGLITKDLKAQAALREAESEAKIQRLTEQLEASLWSHAQTREELDALKDRGQAREPQGLARRTEAPRGASLSLDSLPSLLSASPRLQHSAAGAEDLREQLHALRESNRIAEARVEALKRALASEEAKHRKDIDDLTRRLQWSTSDFDDGAKDSELRELRALLKSTQEERNLLVNTFECKELQWKTEIENLKLELEEAKRSCESRARGLETITPAEDLAPKTAGNARYVAHDVSLANRDASVFGWLRCPTRSASGHAVLKPASCQETCWNMINAMSGIVALWACAGLHNVGDYSGSQSYLGQRPTPGGDDIFPHEWSFQRSVAQAGLSLAPALRGDGAGRPRRCWISRARSGL
ncbi:unnamed protein product [Prorocentrum cordatum]|uniref:Centrosomal protein of 162 kDa n=1 Tax=Prorocentrum cordatum TaxID=2364126 RepID=A0ABN9VSZ3_9DINO|nr:unnamed protein product [Polarella glacialis]